MKYKVRFYQDNLYEVWEDQPQVIYNGWPPLPSYQETSTIEVSVFKGTLSDCEAWIRLHENGYM